MEMTAEQQADLALLNMQANEPTALDIAAEQQQAQQEQSEAQSLQDELQGFISFAVDALKPFFPSIGAIYSHEVIDGLSISGAKLCAKHGWLGGGLFNEWGEEIGFLAVALPIGYATYNGIKGDIAARKKPAISSGETIDMNQVKRKEVYQEPGANTVSFGAAIADQ